MQNTPAGIHKQTSQNNGRKIKKRCVSVSTQNTVHNTTEGKWKRDVCLSPHRIQYMYFCKRASRSKCYLSSNVYVKHHLRNANVYSIVFNKHCSGSVVNRLQTVSAKCLHPFSIMSISRRKQKKESKKETSKQTITFSLHLDPNNSTSINA